MNWAYHVSSFSPVSYKLLLTTCFGQAKTTTKHIKHFRIWLFGQYCHHATTQKRKSNKHCKTCSISQQHYQNMVSYVHFTVQPPKGNLFQTTDQEEKVRLTALKLASLTCSWSVVMWSRPRIRSSIMKKRLLWMVGTSDPVSSQLRHSAITSCIAASKHILKMK